MRNPSSYDKATKYNLVLYHRRWDDMDLLRELSELSSDSECVRRALLNYEWVLMEAQGLNQTQQNRRLHAKTHNGIIDLLDAVEQLAILDKTLFNEPFVARETMLFKSTLNRVDRIGKMTGVKGKSEIVRNAIRFQGLTWGCVAMFSKFYMQNEVGEAEPIFLCDFQLTKNLPSVLLSHNRFILPYWRLPSGAPSP